MDIEIAMSDISPDKGPGPVHAEEDEIEKDHQGVQRGAAERIPDDVLTEMATCELINAR